MGVPWDYGVPCSCSSTPGSSAVCGRDCRSGILMFSYSPNPECDDSCLDVCIPFDQRPVKKMKLVQTEKCGLGVVSEEDIMQGEFIIEYVGEVIDYKTCEERLWRLKSQGETNFYFCEVNRQTVIDATHKGNMSRYMNHSCSPNAEMQKWTVDGETRMVIFASRDIKKGEHLTYDYKISRFMRFGADQDCYCGSLGCRTKLGARPKKSNVSTDAAIKMVACQVAINTLEAKALLSGKKDKIEHGEMGQMLESLPKEFGKPAEIGLPDQLHKSKPNFTYISRNIYPIPTKKVKKRVRVEDDGIFCSCSSTLGSSGICGKDCHCGMLFSTCSSNCKCDESCPNIPFDQRPLKKLKLVQTEKCGSGVVADEDIMQGEFIIEYLGEVIDDKTCEERLWKMKDKGETNFYLCEVKHDMVIDATHKGNISRYINHSCSPNTEMQKWLIDGETRIAIFATRDIKKGESLNYDYRFVQFGADQDCHCGSLGCRTKLGVRPNKSNFPRPKKSKLSALDVAKKMVACQAAITLKTKALPSGRKDVCMMFLIITEQYALWW
ncbi:putative histone-lysine N-methyltransferase ASHH4 isoform X2 [Bidens hawaiensis]|uniref:putative histone-lysine N-methyltransferase ASHH4 isoform X2 n=1 Tax=Bidens hawaiensis TaxID=980011 RepID=UPI004049C58E